MQAVWKISRLFFWRNECEKRDLSIIDRILAVSDNKDAKLRDKISHFILLSSNLQKKEKVFFHKNLEAAI